MPRSNAQSEMYSRYNDGSYASYDDGRGGYGRDGYGQGGYGSSDGYYVDGQWVADVPQGPVSLKPYHMKGRILTFLSLPIGLAATGLVVAAFIAPIPSSLSATFTFVAVGVGLLGVLVGLAGKIRGRKELDLPGWPSSLGVLFGFVGLLVSAMVVFASFQTYSNYSEMLEEQQEQREAEENVVESVMGDDGTVVSSGDGEDADEDE